MEEQPQRTSSAAAADGDDVDKVPTSPNEEASSCDPEQRQSSKALTRGVSFDSVHIREYSRCLDVHPATTSGPSLSIGWDFVETQPISVETYENSRPPRRAAHQMQMPGTMRESIIKEHTDASSREIQQAVTEVQQSRNQRQLTVAMQEFEAWHVAFESMQRKFKRWIRKTSTKREQELLWENAHKTLTEKRKNEKSGVVAKRHSSVEEEKPSEEPIRAASMDTSAGPTGQAQPEVESTCSDSSEIEIKEC